ncbi:MAG: DNA repair protein RadC [Bacteroidales bacterium]|nr:DNA repair protein RadC [Bacteroidales bacterium]MDZ4203752.1 DNA repair protein RadC [Bacteroidales bacterium]
MKKLSDIPDIDKPREKLASRGVQSLSSHELLMVLLGSGLPGRDVSTLATDILKVIEAEKDNITLEKLTRIQGIGKAKAGQILSAFELAKRYLIKEDKKIHNTDDILALVQDIRDKKQEYFITITLTGSSILIEKREVFKGTINFSVVHPREIFADAISDRAAGIIFVHNHPADDAQPSGADIKLTKQLCDAAKILGIQVVDHIIVTKKDYYSFLNEGMLNK